MERSLRMPSKREQLGHGSGKIAARHGSGMTVRMWCQEDEISEETHYCWQQRLFQELTCVGTE